MNQDVNGNKKLFWKEVHNAKGRKVESCSRIKDQNGKLKQVMIKCKGFGRSILIII